MAKAKEQSPALVDGAAKSIIEELQQDGRRSFAEIGRRVGLSEAAVRQRVTKLREAGVIQIVAVTDPLQLGFHRAAMVGVVVNGDLDAVASQIAAIPEVDYVVITAGAFDLLIEVVCENDDHLLHIINNEIRTLAQVHRTETFVYLKIQKQTYTWGTR